jgi:hypothetical protein
MRRGLRRGLVEGSVAWLAVGAAAWVVRYVTRPEPPLVARENLRLGESVLVTHLPASGRDRPRRRRRVAGAEDLPGAS